MQLKICFRSIDDRVIVWSSLATGSVRSDREHGSGELPVDLQHAALGACRAADSIAQSIQGIFELVLQSNPIEFNRIEY